MKVRLTALVNWRIWLVDWQSLEPYWAKHWQYESLRDEQLADAFLDPWFKKTENKDGIRTFNVGNLAYWPKEEKLAFGNGSHRPACAPNTSATSRFQHTRTAIAARSSRRISSARSRAWS